MTLNFLSVLLLLSAGIGLGAIIVYLVFIITFMKGFRK